MKLSSKSIALASLVVMTFFVLFIILGIWQLNRAEQRDTQYRAQLERSSMPVIGLPVGEAFQPEWEFRKVTVSGSFDAGRQILLDNKKHNNRVGYEVLTPLRIQGSDHVVLVNRGWVPAGNDRAVLPDINTPVEELAITGTVAIPAQSHFRPGVDKPGSVQGGVWLYLDLDYFREYSDAPVLPFVILQSPEDGSGFVREWPAPESKSAMHIGYAVQWFVFAIILMAVFIWMVIKEAREGNKE